MRKEHEENLKVVENLYYHKKEELERGVYRIDDHPLAPVQAWGEATDANEKRGWRATADDPTDVNAVRAREIVNGGDDPHEQEPSPDENWRPTLPVGFSFLERKPKLTISQRRLKETLEERRLIEEQEINVPFRATPVPSSSLDVGRLERMEAATELRRQQRKDDFLLKCKHQEFTFLQRQKPKPVILQDEPQPFKAKDCPPSSSKEAALLRKQIQEEKEHRRQERIKARADTLLEEAKMPSRMEVAEHKRKLKEENVAKGIIAEEDIPYWAEECTFTPAIVGSAPDFEKRYRKFEESLAAAKAKMNVQTYVTMNNTNPKPT